MKNINPNAEIKTILTDLAPEEIELTEDESKDVVGGQYNNLGKTNPYRDHSNPCRDSDATNCSTGRTGELD